MTLLECCNQVPQTKWLRPQRYDSRKPEVWCQQPDSCRGLRKNQGQLTLASGASSIAWLTDDILLVTAVFPVAVSNHILFIRCQHVGLVATQRTHFNVTNDFWDDLTYTCSYCGGTKT